MSKKKKPGERKNLKASSPETLQSASPVKISNESTSEVLPENKSMLSRYVSFGLLLGVIALLGILFYEVMATFLVPLFLSALLVVVFRPLYQWILIKTGGREKVSALLTTFGVLVAVLVPIGVLLVMAAAEGREVFQHFNSTRIIEGVRQIRTNLNLDMPSQVELREIETQLLELQQNIALTPADEERHRISLFEVEEAGKVLAAEQNLTWPENVELEPSGDDAVDRPKTMASEWVQFAKNLDATRRLHEEIPFRDNSDAVEKEKRHVALHDYQIMLTKTARHFSNFRTEFMGGKTKAWLIEMVNPSDAESESYAATVVNYLRDKLFRISSAGISYFISLMIGTAIMIIGLYFFLIDGPRLIEGFKGLSPIDDDHEQELVSEFGRVSRAVVVATLLSALVQGLLAGIGFYFAGLDSIFLLTVLSAVLAMVPFVGAAAVWIPCALYLYFIDNNMTAAIGLAVYGAVIVSMADNVIKPMILHGQSNLHPLFAFLSVLGGVSTLGPIGILIGPMVVAFLQTLLKILRREMSDLEQMSHES